MVRKKLPRVPDEVNDQIYTTLCEFGCARKNAILKYAEIAIKDSFSLTDEEKIKSVGLAEKALRELIASKRVYTVQYAQEKVILPARDYDISFQMMDAFEVYVTIVNEMAEKKISSIFCHAGIGSYPFDSIFVASKKGLYQVIVCDQEIIAKVNFFNKTYNPEIDKYFTTLLVFPSEEHITEETSSIELKGKSRIALLKNNGDFVTCLLSDVMES